MSEGARFRSRLMPVVASTVAVGAFVLLILAVETQVGSAKHDPLPSPMYQHVLNNTIESFAAAPDGGGTVITSRRRKAPTDASTVRAAGSLSLRPLPDDEAARVLESAGILGGAQEYDCYDAFGIIRFNLSPSDQFCQAPPPQSDFAQVFGPVIVRRDAPPYSDGIVIQTEILSLNLTGSSGNNGPVGVMQHPSRPSFGRVESVVTDGSGNLISGESFFDIIVIIELPAIGFSGEPANPVTVGAPISSMPPAPGTQHQSQPGSSVPLLDRNTQQPAGWICGFTKQTDSYTTCQKHCVYRLSCIAGDADEIAASGLSVGDLRLGDPCPGNTCVLIPGTVTDNDADNDSVCMLWDFVECAPRDYPPIPGTIAACDCDTTKCCVYTVQCISGHPGDIAALGLPPGQRFKLGTCVNTCPELKSIVQGKHGPICIHWKLEGCLPECSNPDIIGRLVFDCACTPTMNNVPSCAGYGSCPTSPSCPNYISCYNSPTFCMASCPWYATCERSPSCPGYASCPNYPSCLSYPSCPYYYTCYSTPTCEGAVTCTGSPTPFDSSYYPVVFSVDGPTNPAEGLLQPDPLGGHPIPNDVYALSFAGPWGYHTEGELFESEPPGPGVPPGMTNINRISSSLGIGPIPGGPPYRGPFSPNPGAPDPAPLPSGLGLGTLGLMTTDNIDALSFGRDGGNVLLFSVDPDAAGLPGTAVNFNATLSPAAGALGTPPPSNGGGDPGNEAAGDIYRSPQYSYFGGPANVIILPAPSGNNTLDLDEQLMGLQAPAHNYNALPDSIEDDLDALEASSADLVDSDGDGLVEHPDSAVYFSLNASSPSVFTSAAVSEDDILVSPPPGGGPFAFAIYADGVTDLGLLPDDDLDALVLWDTAPRGVWSIGDEVLFSLRIGSPSLAAGANPNMPGPGPFAPGDVFRRGFGGAITLYASAASLGLEEPDELDALDIGRCDCRWDSDQSGQGDVCEPGFTDVGAPVAVPTPPCVTLEFDSVEVWGISAASVLSSGPAAPASFSILPECAGGGAKARSSATTYYEVHTTAEYVGNVTVCIDVDSADVGGPPSSVHMFHYVEVSPGDSGWVDITVSSTSNGDGSFTVCGQTAGLSLFILAAPAAGCACDCHGDPACDGIRSDILDVVATINEAFRGATPSADPNPACPYVTTDVDCSGAPDVIDVVRMVNVAFRGANAATEFCNPCP